MHYRQNDNAVAGLLLALLFALIFSTTAIAFFMLQIYGVDMIAPELNLAKNSGIDFSSHQNFKDCSADIRTTSTQINSKWNYTCEVGMMLINTYPKPTGNMFAYLLMNNLKPDNSNLYDNTYVINNTALNYGGNMDDYCIVLKYTGGMGHNEVCFRNDGVHIPVYGLDLRMEVGDKYFLAYPDINQIPRPTVRTVYKDAQFGSDLSLDVYFNDEKIITTTQLNPEDNIAGFFITRYYGGVASFVSGFALEDFNTKGTITTGNSQDALTQTLGYLYTIWKIATYSLPANVPFPVELSFIFDIMCVGIFICVVIIIRGGS